MWKKNEPERTEPTMQQPSHPQPVHEQTLIGSSLVVKGDVTGDEDITIQGQVEGKVVLKNNTITVGQHGRVKADLFGKVINVEGTVEGNLHAEERVVIRKSGKVKGNLEAPRVTLEDGAKFKGSIEMDVGDAGSTTASPGPETRSREQTQKKAPEPGEFRLGSPSPSKT